VSPVVHDFAGATLLPVGGTAPEDVLVDLEGRVYTGLADGRIVRTDGRGTAVRTVATLPGRPLGLEFLGPDELVVCASDAGLFAVALNGGGVRTLTDRVGGRRLLACNNAAVAADGTVYFTDSSTRYRVPQWRTDLVRRTATGRLLRRSPDGEVTELLGGLEFANGVALAADGSYVAVAETGTCRLHRVWLTGARAGRSELFVDALDGYPDNLALGSDGLIWVALPSPRTALLTRVQRLPTAARAIVGAVPDRLSPRPSGVVSAVAVDDDGRVVHQMRGEIDGFRMLTGVREAGGVLWFGSLGGAVLATVATPQSTGAVP
jgi:sugar lactone lactonase YvrE